MFFAKIRKLFSATSLRMRLTLLYVLVFGVITVVFNMTVFTHTMQSLQQDFDDALFNYAVDVSDSIDIGPRGDLMVPPLRLDNGKILPFPLGTALIQVRHASGQILARVGDFGEWDPPFRRDFQRLENGEEASFRTVTDIDPIPNLEADSYRLISLPLDSATTPQLILQIAVPMTLLETQLKNRLSLLQFGIPAVLLIAILGGFFVSTQALNPVRQMIEAARSIDANDLGQRVPVPIAEDEIKRLALTLNGMLDRIEKSFQSQERFVADASHQLLTPLTILKSELEMFSRGNPSAEEAAHYVASTQQEIETLSRLVQDMLILARVDAGRGNLNMQANYLDEVVLESLARCEKAAKKKQIRLVFDIHGDENLRAPVLADSDLLENLLVNMLENAIKYSPAQAAIHIELRWGPETCAVSIRDHGPGIREQDLPFIFDRFRRAQGADRQAQGFGLGLAIAKKIAELHEGALTAQNHEEGGAVFRLEMKKI